MSNPYPHILSKVFREHWAIREEKHDAIIKTLEAKMNGFSVMEDWDETEPEDKAPYYEVQTTAVIPIHGILGKHLSSLEMSCGGCSLDVAAKMLSVAEKSSRIRDIVFDFNTPGGTVTGTPEFARRILECKKPTYAFTDSDCCSAGIWLASQCDYFYATGSSEVGSVGVRMVLLDCTKALEEEGVKVNPISSGKYKLSGAQFKPLEPEEREMFQAESDRIYEQFKKAVTVKRKVDDEYLQGQIFRGEIAAQIGFTDGELDDLDQLIDRLSLTPTPV